MEVSIQAIVEKVSSAKEPGCIKINIITQELNNEPQKIALLHLLVGQTVDMVLKSEENT